MQEIWTDGTIDIAQIDLDWLNPRIEAEEDSDQPSIVESLICNEHVIELARQIVQYQGLLPGERIIVLRNGSRFIVLEGNRRCCAVLLLIEPSKVPEVFRKMFPTAQPDLQARIRLLKVDIAPCRAAAEPIITKRHTEPGIRQWTPIARVRRAGRLFSEGIPLEKIADDLGSSVSTTKKHVREYMLLQRIFRMNCWSNDEKAILLSPTLKTNPFTRFFSLSDATRQLNISFDDTQSIHTRLDDKSESELLENLVRAYLLPAEDGGKPWANTRTPALEVLNKCGFPSHAAEPEENSNTSKQNAIIEDQNSQQPKPPASSDQPSTPPHKPQPRQAVFLEKLSCVIQDERCLALTKEATRIPWKDLPIAGFFLVRALLEATLYYKLNETNMMAAYKKNLNDNRKVDGLSELLTFCSTKSNLVFSDNRVCDTIHSFRGSGLKDHTDFVIHGKYVEANTETLQRAIKHLRPIIQDILQGRL